MNVKDNDSLLYEKLFIFSLILNQVKLKKLKVDHMEFKLILISYFKNRYFFNNNVINTIMEKFTFFNYMSPIFSYSSSKLIVFK